MDATQSYLPIRDIRDDLLILKDGSIVVVIKTSAVNFGLLSENEQLAIISSFAGLLNSLSFPIQIIIRSKRLDISSYLNKLQEAQAKQNNPLLRDIMGRYRSFIEGVVRENDVLDKKFYIAIPVSYLELGVINDIEKHFQKAMTIINPRRDHISRQLERIGLRAIQLDTEQLAKLFYDIFNESEPDQQESITANQLVSQVEKTPIIPVIPAVKPITEEPQKSKPPVQAQNTTTSPPPIQPQPSSPPQPTPVRTQSLNTRPSPPFVVEELPDEYSTI